MVTDTDIFSPVCEEAADPSDVKGVYFYVPEFFVHFVRLDFVEGT